MHTHIPPGFALRYFIMNNLFEAQNQNANELCTKWNGQLYLSDHNTVQLIYNEQQGMN